MGNFRFYLGLLLLSPTLLGLKMKWINPQAAKEKLIYFYLKRFKKKQLQEIVQHYTRTKLLSIFRETALERLAWHKEQKHEIYVVSASARLWLAEWCKNENINLIATDLEFDNEKLMKKFATPNCNGEEKVNRIKQEIDLQQFDAIFAYGDTEGDRPMLSLAQKPHFQYFKD